MIVTDKKYHLETRLVEKLELMIKRMDNHRRQDNVLLVEGGEGEGKSNASMAVAYYISQRTGRKFDESDIYFDADKMVDVAKSTEKRIFIWDEPALSGLTVEWWKKTQIDLMKLLMVARKKRHFFIFNFTKFFKFNEYIVVDRAIGMIHMYSRYTKDGGIQQGRFAYYKKKSLEELYYHWRSTKRRAYKKHRDFMGQFPWVIPKIIDEQKYEKKKDEAIMSIGSELTSKWKVRYLALQYMVSQIEGLDMKKVAKQFKTTVRTLYRWRKIPEKYPEVKKFLKNEGYDP